MRWVRFGLAAALVALSATIGAGPAEGQSANKQINVVGPPFGFSPTGGAIASGQTVLWENQTGTGHTATSNEFNASIPAGVGNRSSAVAISGGPRTISYHCSIHPEMTGQLQVTAGTGAPPPPPPPPAATAPPPPPASSGTTRTTTRSTATTVRGSTATTASGVTTTTLGFDALATTIPTIGPSTTTTGDIALNQDDDDGGSNNGAIAAITVAILATLTGGGYLIYRLRAN